MTIEEINYLTGSIIKTKGEIASLKYRISEIEKPDTEISACLDLEISRNKRSTSRYFLTNEEVLPILKTRLVGYQYKLKALEVQYAEGSK